MSTGCHPHLLNLQYPTPEAIEAYIQKFPTDMFSFDLQGNQRSYLLLELPSEDYKAGRTKNFWDNGSPSWFALIPKLIVSNKRTPFSYVNGEVQNYPNPKNTLSPTLTDTIPAPYNFVAERFGLHGITLPYSGTCAIGLYKYYEPNVVLTTSPTQSPYNPIIEALKTRYGEPQPRDVKFENPASDRVWLNSGRT